MSKPSLVTMLEAQLPKNPRERVIDLEGQICMETAIKFCKELNELIEEDKIVADFNNQMSQISGGEAYMVSLPPIRINITTPGGYIYWGCMILDALDECIAKTHMHVRGLCASMGIPILCKGDIRSAGKHASFMIHGSSTGLWGYTDDLKGQLQYQEQLDALLDEIVLKNTKVTAEQMDYAKVRSWFFNYEEAFKLGVLNRDVYQNMKEDKVEEVVEKEPEVDAKVVKEGADDLLNQIGNTIKGKTLCSMDILEIESWVCEALKALETIPKDDDFYEAVDALDDIVCIVNEYAEEMGFYLITPVYVNKLGEYLEEAEAYFTKVVHAEDVAEIEIVDSLKEDDDK